MWRLLQVVAALLLSPGLASALSTWGRVPDEREINFYQTGETWTHNYASCVSRRSDSVPISNFGLQDLVQFKRMIDCEDYGGIHAWKLEKDGDSNIRFWFQCCKPNDPGSAEWDPKKARNEERVSDKRSEGNRNWRNHLYVLVGYDSNSGDDKKDRVRLSCTSGAKALKNFKYEHFYISGDEDQWRWHGNCVEMDVYNENWQSTGYEQSMENGETYHQVTCDLVSKIDWLGRLQPGCSGRDEVMTSFVFRPVDNNYYGRTKENGASSKAYFYKVMYTCAQIGRPPPKTASRYAFLRPASNDDCVVRTSPTAPWSIETSCKSGRANMFFLNILQSTTSSDTVRLVHASTGACLLFKGDGTPGAGDCSSGEAKLTYTKDKLIKSGNSLLSVGPGGGLLWSTSATLDTRIIVDTILDGDSIDDYAHVCSDAAKKAYGMSGQDCPLEPVSGVGSPVETQKFKVPMPFKMGVGNKLTFYYKQGDFKAGLAGVSVEVQGVKAAQEIIAPLPVASTASFELTLPAPGVVSDLWILTNREDEAVLGVFSKLKVLGVRIKDTTGKVWTVPPGSESALPWDQATKVPVGAGVVVGVAAAVSGTALSSLGLVTLSGLDTIVSLPKYNFDALTAQMSNNLAPKIASTSSLANDGNQQTTMSTTLTYSYAEAVAITNGLSTTDTVGRSVAWANSYKTGTGFKASFESGIPTILVIKGEASVSFEYTRTRTETESTQRAVANTYQDVKTKTETTGLTVLCSTPVPAKSRVDVSAVFYAGKATVKYTGELVYILQSGANFSYPISGSYDQVSQTNVLCRVGKPIPLNSSSAAATASAAGAQTYRYFQPTKVGVKNSPCGASYTIRTRDVGTPFLRLAYRCKVSTLCLVRANLAFFANEALTYVSAASEAASAV
ncbi:hypothetical protein ABPG77_007842 [Micractinium sp. CCAP 211/92]